MYLWKCWHDSRNRLALYSFACFAVGVVVGLDGVTWVRFSNYWDAIRRSPLRPMDNFDWLWVGETFGLLDYMKIAAVWAGLSLGATSVGREYRSGTMPFLLTRPSSRRRFVWTDWGLGVAGILLILSMFLVGAIPILVYTTKSFFWMPAALLLVMFVAAGLLYSLTHLATTVTGSSMKGLSLSAAIILFYVLFPTALDEWWHIKSLLKIQEWTFQIFDWMEGTYIHFHWGIMGMWAAVAVTLPLLSQLWLKRREV